MKLDTGRDRESHIVVSMGEHEVVPPGFDKWYARTSYFAQERPFSRAEALRALEKARLEFEEGTFPEDLKAR